MIDETAAVGFDASAEAYERGRPEYPHDGVEWILDRTGTRPGAHVVDLAAGTGKLTVHFLGVRFRVTAIEPVPGMRAILQERAPAADILDGTAEAIPLPDASAHLVTVAQAFHWFDTDRAIAEIHRVLRPGGWLALVYNERLHELPIHQELGRIFEPRRGATPSHHRDDRWRRELAETPLLSVGPSWSEEHAQCLDEEGLVDRMMSTSFLAALPSDERAEVEAEVRDVARRHGGRVGIPYRAEVQLFQRAEAVRP